MSWQSLPTKEHNTLGWKRAENRVDYIERQLSRGAKPEAFKGYGKQLGIPQDMFTDSKQRGALNQQLELKKKGYLNFEIDDLKKAGTVDFSTEGQGQPMFARMASEHLGRQPHGRPARQPHVTQAGQHGQHTHEGQGHTQAKQQHSERSSVHTHNIVGTEAIEKAATKLDKALSGDFNTVFGNNITRLEKAIEKQASQTGSNSPDKTPTGSALAGDNSNATPEATPFGQYVATFNASVGSFGSYTSDFATAVASFGKSLANIPSQITLTSSHDITVNVNGADAFNSIQAGLKEMVIATVGAEIDRFKSRLQDHGPGIA
jgi:hypothetical protein